MWSAVFSIHLQQMGEGRAVRGKNKRTKKKMVDFTLIYFDVTQKGGPTTQKGIQAKSDGKVADDIDDAFGET